MLIAEQIKQNGKDDYIHIEKYDDGSIECSPISEDRYYQLYERFGGRSFYEY